MFNENDVQIVKHAGPTVKFVSQDTDSATRSTILQAGEPVKVSTAYAALLASGDPEVGSDMMLGIVRKTGTETSAAEGHVEVMTIIPSRTVLKWRMHTPGNMATQALIDADIGDWFTCDLTGTAFTIDEDDDDDPNVNGLGVIGGDPVEGTLNVYVNAMVTLQAPYI